MRLRLSTNLQVSWDRIALWRDAREVAMTEARNVPLIRAEKRWLGIPREVPGPGNRWRDFPREGLVGGSDWAPQEGAITGDGDVRDLVREADGLLAIVRPGEEVLLGFDAGALPPVAAGFERSFVASFFGWVKDRDPHTALSGSVEPFPVAGKALYP